MKKLVLSLASTALLGGFGAAYAATPLTASTMDGITAAGEYTSCDQNHSNDSRGSQQTQKNVSVLSPQVNVNAQPNVSPNVDLVSIGYTSQSTSNHQSNSQSNFNGNISR